MKQLPHWVITDKLPALYDLESTTTIEMVSKLYVSMQTLIEEYNTYIHSLNKNIDTFESDLTNANTSFKQLMETFVNNFIECTNIRIDKQDTKLAGAIDEIIKTAQSVTEKAIANGEVLKDATAREELAILKNRMNTFSKLTEASTTADAELIDIRNGIDSVIYETAGEAVRKQLKNILDKTDNTFDLHLNNGFDKNKINPVNGHYSLSNGEFVENENYIACDRFVVVKPNTHYSLWYGDGEPAQFNHVCWFNSNKDFISSFNFEESNICLSPENACYLRLSVQKNKDNWVFNEGETYKGLFDYGYSLTNCNNPNNVNIGDLNYFDKSMIVEGGINNGDVGGNENLFALKRIINVPFDITLNIRKGWRLHLFYYINGVQSNPTTEWYIYDSITIEANTPFNFYIQPIVGNKTLHEARNAISITGYNILQSLHYKENPVYYYVGEKLNLVKNKIDVFYKYTLNYEPLSSGGLQACDLYSNVLFVCRGDDILKLYNYETGDEITNLNAVVGHGNAFQFGHTKYSDNDVFPIAFASAFFDNEDDKYTIINKIRVTMENSSLLDKYKMPVQNSGFYGGACVNDDDTILYCIGYKIKNYTNGENNSLIVSAWNITHSSQNSDGSYTPQFIKSFELPFVPVIQGVKYFDGKIFATSGYHDGTKFNSTIFVIDTIKMCVIAKFESLPITLKTNEIEDIFFVPYEKGYKLGVLTAGGIVQEIILE